MSARTNRNLLDGRQFSRFHGASEWRLTGVCTVNDDVWDANAFLQPLLLLRLLTSFHLTTISSRLQTAAASHAAGTPLQHFHSASLVPH